MTRFAQQFFQSLSSVRFYREMNRRSLSDAIKYFSLLILLVTGILSVRFTSECLKALSSFETWSRAHLPEIMIQKGQVSVNVQQPWQKEEKDFILMIDTTGKTTDIDEKYPQGILLTKDKLLLKRGPFESRRYDLSAIDQFRLDSETVRKLRRIGQWLLPPLLALILFVYFWVGKFSQIIFFSGLSLLTNWMAHKDLPYGTLLTIGFYAITPPLLLFCVTALFKFPAPFFDMVYLASYAALLVTAVLQVPARNDGVRTEESS